MTNRSDGRKFLSSGHPSDWVWMESGQTRPNWGEKGPRSTRDSGMGSMENRYGLVPPQTGRRKRHAEDGTLGGRYTEVKRNADTAQWDDSQERILFESKDLESISSDSDSQEVRPGWPRMTCARIQPVVDSRSVKRSDRGSSYSVQRSGAR